MNIGSLYRVKKWYWLLFPSKESTAANAARPRIAANATAASAHAAKAAAYYSKEYNENITWFAPESYVVLLEEDGKLKKVLTSEGLIGWTWFDDRNNDCFDEVKNP